MGAKVVKLYYNRIVAVLYSLCLVATPKMKLVLRLFILFELRLASCNTTAKIYLKNNLKGKELCESECTVMTLFIA